MKEGLSKYLPAETVDGICAYMQQNKVHLYITSYRQSKHGDYRPPIRYSTHRISVNGSLNPYAFLITIVHEMAHLEVWKESRSLKAPHGDLWKKTFAAMMKPYVENGVFPPEVASILQQHLKNPKASSTSDKQLALALRRYDKVQFMTVNDIPEGTLFALGYKIFRKGPKLRTSYLCECLTNGRKYRVSGIAEVVEYTPPDR